MPVGPEQLDRLDFDDLGFVAQTRVVVHVGLRLGAQDVVEGGNGLLGEAEVLRRPVVDEQHPLAHPAHQPEVMAHHHDRRPAVSDLVHAVVALDLEGQVADGEHLVDNEHVGVGVHGHGEARGGRTCRRSRT